MSLLDETSFQLHSIQLISEDNSQQKAAASPSPSPLPSTNVVLEVGTATTQAWQYRCPAYIAQRGSSTLRDLLEDAFESTTAPPSAPVTDGRAPPAHASLAAAEGGAVVLPLPFVEKAVFEVVAVYLEHFYGVAPLRRSTTIGTAAANIGASKDVEGDGSTLTADKAKRASLPSSDVPSPVGFSNSQEEEEEEEGVLPHQHPSPLRRPLNFADLYALSAWEHGFVLHCLLGLAWEQVVTLDLVADGRWVDLLSGGAATSDKTSSAATSCFSASNRQRMWSRLTSVLEAATRLGVPSLQLLCATVAANMVVDLDGNGLGRLMAGGSTAPPFTAEARARLLREYPWLARESKSASATAK